MRRHPVSRIASPPTRVADGVRRWSSSPSCSRCSSWCCSRSSRSACTSSTTSSSPMRLAKRPGTPLSTARPRNVRLSRGSIRRDDLQSAERHVQPLRRAGGRLAQDDRRRARRSGAWPRPASRCRPAGPATSTPANNFDALPRASERVHRLHDQPGQSEDEPRRPRLPGARDDPVRVLDRPRRPTATTRRAIWRPRPVRGRAYPTTVTVYTCQWKPPMAGFVIIPNTITIRAVVTESMQRQQ